MIVGKRWNKLILAFALLAGITFCILTLWQAHRVNHGFAFPLDDPWIHLQFARNLHDYGAFSYYKNVMVTSGSTSPLYTFILAAGFFVTSDEMILSFVLGIGFLAVAAFMAYKVAIVLFDGDPLLSIAAATLLVFSDRLEWAALSGMETMLFVALLLAVLYFYYTKKAVLLGITAGLLLWARPEGMILYAAIVADVVYEIKVVKRPHDKKRREIQPISDFRWIKRAVPYVFIIAVSYFVFNIALSGSFFPNTYAAKLKYYSGSSQDFPGKVLLFLIDGDAYVPAVLALLSILGIAWDVVRRKRNPLLVLFLWSAILFAAYWYDLPKLYQNGRYLMPIIPFFVLFSLDGLRMVFRFLKGIIPRLMRPNAANVLSGVVIVFLVLQSGEKAFAEQRTYIDSCRYIMDRQVKTAIWIRDHVPENAVVATHDIGAIGFYSNRRVVDMVGLVSPEMIANIGRFDLLTEFLIKSGVTHIAVLRNWFEIVNMNPLYQTDPAHPEVMQVFRFDRVHTHFTSQDATRLNDAGEYYLSAGNASYAFQLFRQSFMLDPQSARTNFLIGKTALLLGDTDLGKQRFSVAEALQSDYPGLKAAMFALDSAGTVNRTRLN